MSSYITVNTPSGDFKAYLASSEVLPAPCIVVIQEIFGVNADLRDTCDELASKGYIAVSPDLFWRTERNVDLSDQTEAEWKHGFELYSAYDIDLGVSDIVGTMKAARTLPGASGRVGLMGYCLGGLMTFLTTARHGSDASVAYYGGGIDQHLEESGGVRTPLLMHFGEEDEYISKDAQAAIVGATKSNRWVQIYHYPGRAHAFARHRGQHYDRDAAALANGRTLEFFDMHLWR